MASSFVLVAVFLGACAFMCDGAPQGPPIPVVGGWQKKTPVDSEHYKELAHFAVSKQVEGREFFDTVLEVTDVETQVVAGTNYRITFKIAESTCRVTETYSKETCLPKTRDVKSTCTAVITEPLNNERFVHSFTCGGAAASK
uniref:Putative tick cistatins 1 n=1 Tax=Amblyomma triste TaxID=251400 RepID=A0A023GCY6_AMBTT